MVLALRGLVPDDVLEPVRHWDVDGDERWCATALVHHEVLDC